MKKLLFMFLIFTTSAFATDTNHLNQWASDILKNRANKSWVPIIVAAPNTATTIKKLNNIDIQIDNSLPERKIIIRNKQQFEINDGPQKIIIPANSDMAIQQW